MSYVTRRRAALLPPIAGGALVASNTFEGGSNGTAITPANSGGASGTAFDGSIGSTFTYDNAQVMHGSLAYKCVLATGGSQSNLAWSTALGTLTASSNLYIRYYLYITANPGANEYFCRFATGSAQGGSHMCGFGLDSTGHPALFDTAASTTPKVTSASTVPLSQWIRIEGYCGPLSATVGALEMRVWFTPDSSGAADIDISTAAANTGTTVPANLGFGVEKPTSGYTAWYDDCAFDTAGWIGPTGPPAAVILKDLYAHSMMKARAR